MMNQYNSLNLAMFSGKGGVGKTTLSCGFARDWAKQFPDEKILLISTDPAHSLGDILQLDVTDIAQNSEDLPNLQIQSLNAHQLLQQFKEKYGDILELLVERGSFVQGEDLTPVWDLSWPGLDELMGLLEIERLLREKEVDRIVVDMAPSGHTLNLFKLKNFLQSLLDSVELFQEKHRVISQSLVGRYTPDEVDQFLIDMKRDLNAGKQLLEDPTFAGCLVVAIPEPMSLLETERFLISLEKLEIPCGGLFINRIIEQSDLDSDRYYEQQQLLTQFLQLPGNQPIFSISQQVVEPLGSQALDQLMTQIRPILTVEITNAPPIQWPEKTPPYFTDFIAEGRELLIVGGKGGVGKTTVVASIGWGLAEKYPQKKIRMISIDPAHSLGDSFGQKFTHDPQFLTDNLSGQEIDSDLMLEQFRDDYLWELAEMMSGEGKEESSVNIAYSPQAWRQIVAQALPGIDEMLSLIKVMDLLDQKEQDLIILDTAPTGHLLRFLEMPSALGDWLAWIFKLWMKYQDVLGRVDLMGRLRKLRQQVMQAQKHLRDSNYTEFIGVVQAQKAILSEQIRLGESLQNMGIHQRYLVHNRYQPGEELSPDFPLTQTIIHLPLLPRSAPPLTRIQQASHLLF